MGWSSYLRRTAERRAWCDHSSRISNSSSTHPSAACKEETNHLILQIKLLPLESFKLAGIQGRRPSANW
ncbi:unnamed protein product [Musa banksii]